MTQQDAVAYLQTRSRWVFRPGPAMQQGLYERIEVRQENRHWIARWFPLPDSELEPQSGSIIGINTIARYLADQVWVELHPAAVLVEEGL